MLTTGDRNRTYGDPVVNHEGIASLWRAYLAVRGITVHGIDAEDVMLMMALLKIDRLAQRKGAGTDSMIDAAAYIAMAVEARAERKGEPR